LGLVIGSMTIVSAQAPAFEVATVKPNTSATPPSSTFFQRGSQVAISNHRYGC
jgi:hypothetical protein